MLNYTCFILLGKKILTILSIHSNGPQFKMNLHFTFAKQIIPECQFNGNTHSFISTDNVKPILYAICNSRFHGNCSGRKTTFVTHSWSPLTRLVIMNLVLNVNKVKGSISIFNFQWNQGNAMQQDITCALTY